MAVPGNDGYAEAVTRAWKGQLPFEELIGQAEALASAGAHPLAAVLYQTWLARNASPFNHAAQFNLGVVLTQLEDLAGAQRAYEAAIALAPGFAQPRLNLGLLHERQGRPEEAIAQWRWVADHTPVDGPHRSVVVMALNHLGRLLESRKALREALECLHRSLLLQPQQPDVIHHWVFLRQKQCHWPVYPEMPGLTEAQMKASTSALATIALSDDPAQQLEAARQFVARRFATDLPRLAPPGGYRHERLRIAYCSGDFCLHPVSMLTVQLFELHDRTRFEVFGFDWSPEDGSAMRQRVRAAMDHFIPIGQLSDQAAAELIRSHEIDILVDLHGQTSGARPNMLGWRPAPVQITYLGQPATTGLPCIDLVIADTYLIPPEAARFYSERPLYMPHIYQVSDRLRAQGPAPTRAACGLPEDAFVFCSFNNSYKYTEPVFARWMSILRRVPHAVLWLLADNPAVEQNLRAAAQAAGIAPERLLFAGRLSPENYLARFQVPDLFLDTFPFNAGTTANDALWMGCPLLTLSGRSFASRMAGALLTAAGLPELITQDLDHYEEAAVALAQNPARCAALRETLGRVRADGVLFDTPRFVRDLEQRLLALPAAGQ